MLSFQQVVSSLGEVSNTLRLATARQQFFAVLGEYELATATKKVVEGLQQEKAALSKRLQSVPTNP